jgi:hypothetical protein
MNEPWSYFTDDEVFGANVKERQSIATIRGRDDLPDICAQVTGQIRQAYIFSNRELGAEGTIPDGFKARAVAMATWRFVSEGVPQNDSLQTRARQSANTEAVNYLNQVASVKIGRTGTPVFGKRGTDLPARQFTDNTQDG